MNNKILIVILLCVAPGLVYSQFEKPGSTSGEFLNIGVNARAEAMSGSFISVVDGPEAVYYNPAALVLVEGTALAASYTSWFAGLNHQFAVVSHSMGNVGVVALSLTAMQTDEMIVRTPLQPDGTGETFYAGSYRLGLSYARALTNNVYVGLSGNYIRIQLYTDFIEEGFSGDIAVMYNTGVRNFRFGLHIANFGSEIKFVNESYPLPTSFSFGVSANLFEGEDYAVLVSAAAKKPNDAGPQPVIGAEYGYQKRFFLRGGYTFDDIVKTFSFGAGLNIPMGSYKLTADYSYNDFSALGGAQRVTLGFKF